MTGIDEPVAAGVIGVGSMGRHHARVYSELPNVDLVGVYDTDEERAAEIAQKTGTRSRELEEVIDRANVVSIATPTSEHFDIAKRCIRAGVHVLIEKPFVDRMRDGERLIELAEKEGTIIQVGHVERFNPAITALRDIVPDLDIIGVDTKRLGPPIDRSDPDNVVMDLMIHDIDILLWLANAEVTSLSAAAVDEEYATATFAFGNELLGTLTASRRTQQKVRSLSITAESCHVLIDYMDQSIEIHRQSVPEYVEKDGGIRFRHESVIERPMVENVEPLKAQLRSFVNAATSGTEPVVSARDGLRALSWARDIETAVGYSEPEE